MLGAEDIIVAHGSSSWGVGTSFSVELSFDGKNDFMHSTVA